MKRKVSHKGARQKGSNFEREVVALINDYPCDDVQWLGAERVPLSGAAGGSYAGDIKLRMHAQSGSLAQGPETIWEKTLECKKRENLSKQLWEWLEGNDVLVIGRNRYKPLVIIPLEEAIRLWSKD